MHLNKFFQKGVGRLHEAFKGVYGTNKVTNRCATPMVSELWSAGPQGSFRTGSEVREIILSSYCKSEGTRVTSNFSSVL
jgi:hypothetical protein